MTICLAVVLQRDGVAWSYLQKNNNGGIKIRGEWREKDTARFRNIKKFMQMRARTTFVRSNDGGVYLWKERNLSSVVSNLEGKKMEGKKRSLGRVW